MIRLRMIRWFSRGRFGSIRVTWVLMPQLRSEFVPLPPQAAFMLSKAKIRGYGGAMGGGKSRTACEDVFDACLDNPGLVAVVARQSHTSIVETTKKTMLNQVIPSGLVVRKLESGGQDFVELFNGSRIHFIGLDDPYRWYSSELGYLAFDEAHEIAEETVIRMMTRLRQPGMPHRVVVTFNPANPGHWLQKWFLLGGERTEHGFRKEGLVFEDAATSSGSCEFFFAKASDNTHLPEGYVEQTLSGLPERLRRRYLEGIWEFITGNNFFDIEALTWYQRVAMDAKPLFGGRTAGDTGKDFLARQKNRRSDDPPRFQRGPGLWTVWKQPVRAGAGGEPAHRYVMAVDISSGGGYDYSGIQIVDVESFEQVAEYQAKVPPTDLAVEVYRAGRVYNNALAVPEITGGWGFTIEQELKRLHYPNIYTRKILDRLTKKWTDRTGWDTTARTRAHMLDTLDRVLREQEFGLYSLRALTELATFVYGKNNKPEAQDGMNDDLVISLAIAVTVTLDLPRQVKRLRAAEHKPQYAATGY
jgi:hypothetical protein